MSERSERDDRSRQAAEGVRIIKAEEAQAALDAGEAAGRRPDDQLRFGDVPPAPQGPRPAHRFPLPDSVDPAQAVSLPPLAPAPSPGPATRRAAGPSQASETRASETQPRPASATPGWTPPPPPPRSSRQAHDPSPSDPSPSDASPSEATTFDATTFDATTFDATTFDATTFDAGPTGQTDDPLESERPLARDPNPRSSLAGLPASARPHEARPQEAWPHEGRPDEAWRQSESGAGSHGGGEWPQQASGGGSHQGWPDQGWTDRTAEITEVSDEGITVSGGAADMPHWTDPPTGEVPRLRFDDDDKGDADMEAWRALGSRGVRWREDDWDDAEELSDLVGDVEPVGALDSSRAEHSDIYSFDEDFERVTNRTSQQALIDLSDEAGNGGSGHFAGGDGRSSGTGVSDSRASDAWADDASAGDTGIGGTRTGLDQAGNATGIGGDRRRRSRTRSSARDVDDDFDLDSDLLDEAAPVGVGAANRSRPAARPTPPRHRGTPPERPGRGPGGGEPGGRVLIGLGLLVLLIIAYAVGPKALMVLTGVIVVATAAEAYRMTQGAGFRPATLLGLVGTAGCVLAAYWKGVGAIPVVAVLLFAGTVMWYVLGIVEARPLVNVAVTVMIFVWVGVLGSFGAVMLGQHHGKGEFLGAVLVAVAADIAAFVVGRAIGSRPMAAHISPHKTVEGFLGGLAGALIVGALVGHWVHPWAGIRHGLVLGLVIGLIAPVGDLFESLLKRDLGIKDSGSILGGHGGLLDRFDAVLLALPAAYFVITAFKL